ncbi:unnamed protein product, partial [Staurois parvus]
MALMSTDSWHCWGYTDHQGTLIICALMCLDAAWHGSYQPVALLRCYGRPGCFNSGLQLFCV